MIIGQNHGSTEKYSQTATLKKSDSSTKDEVHINGETKEKGFFARTGDKIKNFYEKSIKGYNNLDYRCKHRINGALVGATIGGAAGYMAAELQETNNVSITRTYKVPAMENRNLGQIPNDWYQHDFMFDTGPKHHAYDYAPNGWETIHENAPVLNGERQPVMVDKTETLSSQRYNKLGGTFIGIAIGSIVGMLGTIAFDLISHFGDAE